MPIAFPTYPVALPHEDVQHEDEHEVREPSTAPIASECDAQTRGAGSHHCAEPERDDGCDGGLESRAVTGRGDGFEARPHPEGSEQMADVVSDRFRAQVELLGDLLCRASALEETKYLGLPGRQMRGRCARRFVERAGQQPEDADHTLSADQGNRAHLQREPGSVGRDEDRVGLGRRGRAEHLACEELLRPCPVLQADNRREVPAANVAEEALGRRVDPPDNAGRVEDVTRDE